LSSIVTAALLRCQHVFFSEALVTRKFRIPGAHRSPPSSAQITNTKAACFPSDPQLPLNSFEKMDKVRVTILLAVCTPRHRCAASLHPSGKCKHLISPMAHAPQQSRSSNHAAMGPPCSHPWQSGPPPPHSSRQSMLCQTPWTSADYFSRNPPTACCSPPPCTIACLDRTAVQSAETITSVLGFQANVRQRQVRQARAAPLRAVPEHGVLLRCVSESALEAGRPQASMPGGDGDASAASSSDALCWSG
jgi:hypothetical protein